jgi:hypothetical protein
MPQAAPATSDPIISRRFNVGMTAPATRFRHGRLRPRRQQRLKLALQLGAINLLAPSAVTRLAWGLP